MHAEFLDRLRQPYCVLSGLCYTPGHGESLLWLEALAGLKAFYDLASGVPDYVASYKRHKEDQETIAESRRASETFSTFSDAELEALIRKIEGCRERFISQGSGRDRTRCLCSIFKEIIDGNGGRLPRIDAWERIYEQLRCHSKLHHLHPGWKPRQLDHDFRAFAQQYLVASVFPRFLERRLDGPKRQQQN